MMHQLSPSIVVSSFFHSYRDPNSTATLNAFHQCIEWCLNERFVDEDVNEAKLSLFAQVSNTSTHCALTEEMMSASFVHSTYCFVTLVSCLVTVS